MAVAKSARASSVAPRRSRSPGFSYLALHRASPGERIDLIRSGLPAVQAKRIFDDLALGQGAALKALKLSAATVNKKAKQDQSLTPGESERVIGVAKLVGQLEAIIQESGDLDGFDAAGWMSRWLCEPSPALGGVPPIQLMDTMEGQALVSASLAKIQSGAYA